MTGGCWLEDRGGGPEAGQGWLQKRAASEKVIIGEVGLKIQLLSKKL